MKKKTVSILAALTLTVGLLAGCGSSNGSQDAVTDRWGTAGG